MHAGAYACTQMVKPGQSLLYTGPALMTMYSAIYVYNNSIYLQLARARAHPHTNYRCTWPGCSKMKASIGALLLVLLVCLNLRFSAGQTKGAAPPTVSNGGSSAINRQWQNEIEP